jgi:NAD(P)-dependent dehydrogenase (short-subunit alcohol dehydrogenase family)
VNALTPGFFQTELTDGNGEGIEALLPRIPTGRVGNPEELSAALIFLASEASSYVTASNLVVDGGFVSS